MNTINPVNSQVGQREESRLRVPTSSQTVILSVFRFAHDSLLEGDGFEPSVPGAKEPVSGGEGDLRVIETEASHKKLFLLRGTDISNPSSSSSESAAKRTVAAPRAGRRRAPITGEGTESKKAIRRASVARPVASHTTGTARRTRAKVTD